MQDLLPGIGETAFVTGQFASISNRLASFSEVQLVELISQTAPLYSGVGGKSVLLHLEDVPVFVKQVPLTDLERRPKNWLSTANLFELPLYFQYRLGSPGFGAWRELATHQMTTDWVLSGECPNFPLLYHWRVVPSTGPDPMSQAELERQVRVWDNSGAVRARLEALQNASACVLLCLQYFPQNLQQWLSSRLTQQAAIAFVDENLRITNSFMQEQGLTHFDAHFENILTDGQRLYFSDFGLALSGQFDLSQAEREFLARHGDFDRCNSALSLMVCLFGGERWEARLGQYLDGLAAKFPATVDAIARRDAPLALALKEFFRQLVESKLAPYPADLLARLASTQAAQQLKLLAGGGQG